MALQFSPHHSSIAQHVSYIENIVKRGGPAKYEWTELNQWIESIGIATAKNLVSENDLNQIRNAFGDSFSLKTIQGMGFHKPRGYAGDFEVIDRMYTNYQSDDPHLRRWDAFMQNQESVKAVRNRKDYFKNWVVQQCLKNTSAELSLLNLASGPGRDLAELLIENPNLNLTIDCVEMDAEAISYASCLLPAATCVRFIHQNAFKFKAERSYDLIWSAGLFDYFDDAAFALILRRLLTWVNPTGEIAIGNFQPNHGTYYYLQLLDWQLYHRSEDQLRSLGIDCGIPPERLHITSEPLGANLFLHIKNEM